MSKLFARIVGAVLLLLGIGGLFIDGQLLDVLNVDLAEDVIHIATGGLLLAVGFAGPPMVTRATVAGLGVVYLLVGIVGFIFPRMYGLLPTGLSVTDNIVHLVIGAIALGAAAANRSTA